MLWLILRSRSLLCSRTRTLVETSCLAEDCALWVLFKLKELLSVSERRHSPTLGVSLFDVAQGLLSTHHILFFNTEAKKTSALSQKYVISHVSRIFVIVPLIANFLSVFTRKHDDDRRFVCTEEGCGKSFTRAEHLKGHSITHLGTKPFQCHAEGVIRKQKIKCSIRTLCWEKSSLQYTLF